MAWAKGRETLKGEREQPNKFSENYFWSLLEFFRNVPPKVARVKGSQGLLWEVWEDTRRTGSLYYGRHIGSHRGWDTTRNVELLDHITDTCISSEQPCLEGCHLQKAKLLRLTWRPRCETVQRSSSFHLQRWNHSIYTEAVLMFYSSSSWTEMLLSIKNKDVSL